MQKASLRTHAKVQFLATYGPDTAQNAIPYLNTLVQRQCSVIVAADPAPVGAIVSDAHRFPDTTFVVVGKKTTNQPNVVVVPLQAGRTADEVARTVVAAMT